MNVMECIANYVDGIAAGAPVFTRDIHDHVAGLLPGTDRAVVNGYVARYARRNPGFVRHRKGIYYKTVQTPFGPAGIDIAELIRRTYLYDGGRVIGYETGPSYMHKAGLTAQMPKLTFIATENIRSKPIDGIRLVKPVTGITEENYRCLQLLDMMDNRFKVCFEDGRAKVFREFIDRHGLSYERLLYYARLYRNTRIYREIADTTTGDVR